MLTISELAGLVGATPRTIRHYHRLGLLPEPPRRANGYRSYGPAHLIRLTRIRRLRDVGLSLAEIGRLLDGADADPANPGHGDPGHRDPDRAGSAVRAALLALDEDLARQQRDLARRRRDLAGLLAGPRDVTLPAELAELVDQVAALGADPADVATERDALALAVALHPEQVPTLVNLYRHALGQGAELMAAGRRFAALVHTTPDDPLVAEVAGDLVAALRRAQVGADAAAGTPTGGRDPMVEAFLDESLSPAQRRCAELIGEAFT